jgi:hypothetical protein
MRPRWCFWAWPGETEFKVGAHGFLEFLAFVGGKLRSPDALVQFSKRSELIWLSSEVLKCVQPLGEGGNFSAKTQELPPQPTIEMCSCGKLLKGPFGRGEANAVVHLMIAVVVVDLFSKIGFTRVKIVCEAALLDRRYQTDEHGNTGEQFLVLWKGHSYEDSTWEPASDINNQELIQQYYLKHPESVDIVQKSIAAAQPRLFQFHNQHVQTVASRACLPSDGSSALSTPCLPTSKS